MIHVPVSQPCLYKDTSVKSKSTLVDGKCARIATVAIKKKKKLREQMLDKHSKSSSQNGSLESSLGAELNIKGLDLCF